MNQDQHDRRNEAASGSRNRHARKPARTRLIGDQVESRQAHCAGERKNGDRGKQNPELPRVDVDIAELQPGIEHEHCWRHAERNKVGHGVEFGTKIGCRFEKTRRHTIHDVKQSAPDNNPGGKLELPELDENGELDLSAFGDFPGLKR